MKKLVLNILILFGLIAVFAQQNTNFASYSFFLPITNYSFIAEYQGLGANLHYRDQWAGFKDAPETALLTVYGVLNNLGVGVQSLYDRVGIYRSFALSGFSAYKAQFAKNNYLLIGANINFRQNFLKLDLVENVDYSDPALNSNKFFETIFEAGVSAVYRMNRLWIGASSPRVYSTVFNSFLQDVYFQAIYQFGELSYYKRNYVRILGQVHLNALKFYVADIGAVVRFNDYFEAMLLVRSNLSAAIGVNFSFGAFTVGYSYEASMGYAKYLSISTNEIYVGFNLQDVFKF